MRKSQPRETRLLGRLALASGVLTVAGAGVAVAAELRHRRSIAADPDWPLLRSPVAGKVVSVRSADGTELHAEVFGAEAAPTVVLVPGWTEELQLFDLLTRGLLGRGFRVVAFDPRGQGLSDCTPGLDQSIERYAEDVTAVLAATCAERDEVIVAGHSMGGMSLVAWAAAVDVREYVRGVALISTGVSGLVDDLGLLSSAIPVETRRAILTPLLMGDQPMITLSTPMSRALDRYMLFGPDATAAHVAFAERMIWRMHGKLRAGAARTMRDLDLTAALERVNVPTLVAVGDVDRLTPIVHARRMVGGLPQVAEFLVLPRTGHMTPLERPVELADALERLASGVGLEPTSAVGTEGLAPLAEPPA